jgi:hypothetical protein
MTLAEIAVLAHEALEAAAELLNAEEAEMATAGELALVSIAASLYLDSVRHGAPLATPITSRPQG